MSVPAAISLVTLGVRDVRAATAFYQTLGFRLSSASVDGEVSFFHTAGGLLAVWGVEDLQADAGAATTPEPGAFRGVSLAINVESEAAVDAALEAAAQAGGRITKPAGATEWGGYQGYFADPDSHYWEVAYNPFWPIGADGRPQLPD
ncbi:MAG TPA: VOC family protein [Jatrophihabitans sp.]|nr:VOC family protein [Jatrophihabitans sp.]